MSPRVHLRLSGRSDRAVGIEVPPRLSSLNKIHAFISFPANRGNLKRDGRQVHEVIAYMEGHRKSSQTSRRTGCLHPQVWRGEKREGCRSLSPRAGAMHMGCPSGAVLRRTMVVPELQQGQEGTVVRNAVSLPSTLPVPPAEPRGKPDGAGCRNCSLLRSASWGTKQSRKGRERI